MEDLMKATFLVVAVLAASAAARADDTLKTANIQRYYTPVKFDLIGAASVMPADSCGFKLDPAQMNFGSGSTTDRAHHLDCSTLRGDTNPMEGQDRLIEDQGRDHEGIGESFDYCDAIVRQARRPEDSLVAADGDRVPPYHRPQQRNLRQRRRLPAREPHPATLDRTDAGDAEGYRNIGGRPHEGDAGEVQEVARKPLLLAAGRYCLRRRYVTWVTPMTLPSLSMRMHSLLIVLLSSATC